MDDLTEEDWNEELEEEVSSASTGSLVVYSRDWTVETILSQISQDNINLNPKFQRRNAWTDKRRSLLIESLLIGIPVPEIVLAEDLEKKKAFIVIDGKQRLLAISGFVDEKIGSWDSPRLRDLKTRSSLNGSSYSKLNPADVRQFRNSDIRCTVISNYKKPDVLYDIFYRLNTGSVPLSSQELRQALNRGPFANFLITATNKTLPLHQILRLDGPDRRLRDAEILLRFLAFSMFGRSQYQGNLTSFLDWTMKKINKEWAKRREDVQDEFIRFNAGCERLIRFLGVDKVGRKLVRGGWESRFNRALFEVEAYYFARIPQKNFEASNPATFVAAFRKLSSQTAFRESIESTTKTTERYRARFSSFEKTVNTVFHTKISSVPLPD